MEGAKKTSEVSAHGGGEDFRSLMQNLPGCSGIQGVRSCCLQSCRLTAAYHPLARMRPRAGMMLARLPFSSEGFHIGQRSLASFLVFLFRHSPHSDSHSLEAVSDTSLSEQVAGLAGIRFEFPA